MKKVLLTLCLFSFLTIKGQESQLQLSIYQDLRLLFFGDERGNSALTPNMVLRLDAEAFKFKKHQIHLSFGIEYADLNSSNFLRFFLGFGHTFELSFLDKFAFGTFINHGIIFRGKGSFFGNKLTDEGNFMGLSINFEMSYPIAKKLRLIGIIQTVDRRDLTIRFNATDRIRTSGFMGVKYSF
ncbi:MAG: hypothetical protein HWD85_05925 [Flavobacteriaceae bacterium]|nr:hypothetical protein [Flavobacteriaceae bacterium]